MYNDVRIKLRCNKPFVLNERNINLIRMTLFLLQYQ